MLQLLYLLDFQNTLDPKLIASGHLRLELHLCGCEVGPKQVAIQGPSQSRLICSMSPDHATAGTRFAGLNSREQARHGYGSHLANKISASQDQHYYLVLVIIASANGYEL